jgi:hypothetical protein
VTPKQRGRNTRRNSEGTPKQRRNPEGTPKKPRSFSASKKTRMNQRCYFLLFGLVEKVCSLNLPMELVFRMTVQYDYTESIVGIGMYFGFYRQLIAGSGSSRARGQISEKDVVNPSSVAGSERRLTARQISEKEQNSSVRRPSSVVNPSAVRSIWYDVDGQTDSVKKNRIRLSVVKPSAVR